MDRAADAEAARLRHVQQFHVDALAREGGVAVDEDRHALLFRVVAAARLARAHGTGDDRIHDFQMRRIEREREMHGVARRFHVGAETHVVFHVAGMRRIVRMIELAFELGEEFLRRLAEQVDQHVQAAAMRHADDHVAHAVLAALADQFVEQRHQAVAAFEREALLADVFRVQIALEAFGLRELFERVLAFFGAEVELAADTIRAARASSGAASASLMCMNSAPMVLA